MSIIVNCSTWERDDSGGMFDYSQEQNVRSLKVSLQNSFSLLRNISNYNISIADLGDQFDRTQFEHIMTVIKEKSVFHLLSQEIGCEKKVLKEPFCRIVNSKGYVLKKQDRIKIGKVFMEIIDWEWKKDARNHYYKSAKMPYLSFQMNTYTTSFYTNGPLIEASMLETNPGCRYCFGKSITKENPFVTRCECSGSSKYTHALCLVEWIRKRRGEGSWTKPGLYSIPTKALCCEVCKTMYKVKDMYASIFDVKTTQPLTDYLVFNIKQPENLTYLLLLNTFSSVIIGRGHECDILINQLSVSRKHCILSVDYEEFKLTLFDQNAKFGTVVEVEEAQVTEQFDNYQKGRTRINIRMEKKKSFFQKFGICTPQEQLYEYKQ